VDPSPTPPCTYAREFITTLEFLRNHKDLAIPEKEAQALAMKMTEGCTGAAERFIKITSVLLQSGVSANNALETGIQFSLKTDAQMRAFNSIFLNSFSEDGLALDIKTSLDLARSLLDEFKGDVPAVAQDFEKLIQFCMNEKELNLPRAKCGVFSARVARRGQNFGGSIFDSFVKTFRFLQSEVGPDLSTPQALDLAEELIDGGKTTIDNFTQAYRYGVSTKGLSLPIAEAIAFARKMTVAPSMAPLPVAIDKS
jgi:hypothetical protein